LGSLLQTADGTDWARLDRVATRDEIDVVSCTDSNTCTAGGPHSPIMRTNNAGVTWSPQSIPATFFVTAISCTDDNTCTAVEEDNTAGTYIAGILHTTDGGNTWTQQQQSNGTPRPLEAVSCTDNNTCTALGAGCTSTCSSIILRTTDGGTTWTQSFEYVSSSTINQSYLRDLSCPDSNTCTAVGQQLAGTVFTILILRTTDGGTTWIQQSARAPIPSGIACPDVNTCIAVGGGGSVRTTDGGATWTVANSGIFPSH